MSSFAPKNTSPDPSRVNGQLPNYVNKKIALPIIGCSLGCLVLAILFPIGIIYFTSVILEHSWFLKSDASHYDPIASFQEAQDKAGADAKFYQLEARYVKPDGTMELTANYTPGPQATFSFYRDVDAPKNAPPAGVSGAGSNWYETINILVEHPWQSYSVSSMSGGGRSRYSYFNFGIKKDSKSPTTNKPGETVDPPKCPLADLWKIAISKGADAKAVSTVTYDTHGYKFEIVGQSEMQFSSACQYTSGGNYDSLKTPADSLRAPAALGG